MSLSLATGFDCGSLSGTLTQAAAPTATFADVIYTAAVDREAFTLVATSDSISSVPWRTRSIVSVVVATALAFTTQPAGAVGGNALTTQPVVTAQDDDGTTDTDFTETVTLTKVDGTGAGTLSGYLDIAAVDGVAAFVDVGFFSGAVDGETFQVLANDEDTVDTDLSGQISTVVTFAESPPGQHAYVLPAGWNMVSLPYELVDPSLSAVFPGAVSLFGFDAGYRPATALVGGEGYWVNTPNAATFTISGTPCSSLSWDLPAGWSIIGIADTPVDISAIQEACGQPSIGIFGFNGGYFPIDTIMYPGKAYWINLSSPCQTDLTAVVGNSITDHAHDGAGSVLRTEDKLQPAFRPTAPWASNPTRGTMTLAPNDQAYGSVTHAGNKWARSFGSRGELRTFTPQYVMYDGPAAFYGQPKKIDGDIQTFLVEHGFTGSHVPVFCRWFDLEQERSKAIHVSDPTPDRRTFQALELLISKVHAAGGVVHLWTWDDEQRTMTPARWGINGEVDERLQRYIAARLGPLPGWTMGCGFDLWEWVDGRQLSQWRRQMHARFGWPHMLGARARKNDLDQLSESLDYSAYEQHRPDYAKYVETIESRPQSPSFSEDRLRIRQSSRYASKDYSMETTRRGLWRSTMARA